MIYHITNRAAWSEAKKLNRYSASSLAGEGFIHCSKRDQVLAVANEIFQGQENLLLLCIDESKLTSALRWEAPAHPEGAPANDSKGEAQFPHLYGSLNLEAVVGVFALCAAESGFRLPTELP